MEPYKHIVIGFVVSLMILRYFYDTSAFMLKHVSFFFCIQFPCNVIMTFTFIYISDIRMILTSYLHNMTLLMIVNREPPASDGTEI